MNDSSPIHNDSGSDLHPSPPVAGEDLLPEVEPPSAGFILQLFVVPAVIVSVIFSVWLSVSWLVHRTKMNPEDLVQGLQSSSVARWQRASELADILRNERYAEFRESSAAATKLAAILDREIDAAGADGGMSEKAADLRYFLCRALGEFRVVEGLDVLLKAATTNRHPEERIVRRGAIEAIAVRAFNLSQLDPPLALSGPDLEPTLLRLASDEDDLIRSETAYALGQLSTPTCLTRLETMVEDPHADTRYNAAVALAQHGNATAIETLAEMLDPEEMGSVRQEKNEQAEFYKRALIMTTALDATEQLAQQSPDADFSDIVETLERVLQSDAVELRESRISPGMVKRAQQTLGLLQRHAVEATAAEPSP